MLISPDGVILKRNFGIEDLNRLSKIEKCKVDLYSINEISDYLFANGHIM